MGLIAMNFKQLRWIGLALAFGSIAGCGESSKQNQKPVETHKAEVAPVVSVENLSLEKPENQKLAKTLLGKTYGVANYDAQKHCWLQRDKSADEDDEGALYCMKAVRLDKVSVGEERRWYIQTSGKTENAEQITLGTVGFFIVDAGTEQIIASEPISEFPIGYGEGPDALKLVQLSATGYFGWFGEGGFTFQGNTTSIPVIAAPRGKKIEYLEGNIPGTGEDTQELEYSYRADTSKASVAVYPLIITEKNTETGKVRTFTAAFDRKRWVYHCKDKSCLRNEGK